VIVGQSNVVHCHPPKNHTSLSLARVMGPPDCQGDGTTVARY
jgi:hypothetical protein